MSTTFRIKCGWVYPILFLFLFCKISFGKEVQKVVSLTPSISKQIIALNGKALIVGCTNYCPKEELKDAAVVGSLMSVNIEEIVRLKPDIVLANDLIQAKYINKLKELGIDVKIFSYPKSISDILAQVVEIGKIIGKEKEALSMVKEAEISLDKIKKMYAQQETKKVFFVLGVSPLFTANKDTYIDDLLNYINAENIAKDFNSSIVSKEYIFRENPDVIIVMNMGIASRELIDKWKSYTFLNAVKYNKIFEVDADKVASPALPEFIDVIKEIGEKVHR